MPSVRILHTAQFTALVSQVQQVRDTGAAGLLDDGIHMLASSSSFDWSAFEKLLPTGKDEASVAVRRKFFHTCDVSGNGLISLAEFDRGLRTFIGATDVSERVWRAKPAIARAFHAAKGSSKAGRSRSADGLLEDDYVSRSEFR